MLVDALVAGFSNVRITVGIEWTDFNFHAVMRLERRVNGLIYLNLGSSGFSSLGQHGQGAFKRLEVKCPSLDEVVPPDRHFEFLKIDVEGSELSVLGGAVHLLARDHPSILFECGPSGPALSGYKPAELHDFLTANHYSVFFLKDALDSGDLLARESCEGALVYPFKAFNWLAVATEFVPAALGSHRAREIRAWRSSLADAGSGAAPGDRYCSMHYISTTNAYLTGYAARPL